MGGTMLANEHWRAWGPPPPTSQNLILQHFITEEENIEIDREKSGSFNEHIAVLRRLGVKGVEVRKSEQLDNISALIIPGGESTTMAKLAAYQNLFPALRDFVKTGKPVWGTCAGLIFLADKIVGHKEGGQELIGGLQCTVHRNFFGSQIQSFVTELAVPELQAKEGGPATFSGVFIRAPAILEADSEVEVLASYSVQSKRSMDPKSATGQQEENTISEEKVIVAVKQGNLLGTAFHPELTDDTRWHSYFLKMVGEEEQLQNVSPAVGEATSQEQKPRIDLPVYV